MPVKRAPSDASYFDRKYIALSAEFVYSLFISLYFLQLCPRFAKAAIGFGVCTESQSAAEARQLIEIP